MNIINVHQLFVNNYRGENMMMNKNIDLPIKYFEFILYRRKKN